MAFGKIQGRDLDPTMDLAKETTLAEVKSTVESTGATMTSVAKESTVNAVKSVVDEINTNTATVAKESTLTEVKSMVEEIRGDGTQESNVADGDIVMALASDDAGANE